MSPNNCRQRCCFIIIGLVVACLTFTSAAVVVSNQSDTSTGDVRSIVDTNIAGSGRSLIIKSLLLAPLGILLLFALATALIPVPVISTGRSFKAFEERAMDLAKSVMMSEECIERVSCEVNRVSRRHEMLSWVPQTIDKYLGPSPWGGQISRGMTSSKSCKQFTCDVSSSLRRAFIK